jgi:S1-C subfamily serine protease
VRYTNGTFGAKLTSDPIPNSPASQLPLNAGDIIFMLDGKRFTSPDDLLKPVDQTGVNYIDASSHAQQSGFINIPKPPGA